MGRHSSRNLTPADIERLDKRIKSSIEYGLTMDDVASRLSISVDKVSERVKIMRSEGRMKPKPAPTGNRTGRW